MTGISVGSVDVLLLDPAREHRVLLLQRASGTRCTGAWEVVHGRIEAGERAEEAALRENGEETGLRVSRLYNVTCQAFYLQHSGSVNVAVVFAAFADSSAPLVLGPEHATGIWVSPEVAERQLSWPRTRQALREALTLLQSGDAGPVEDVLRVDTPQTRPR